MNRIKVDLNKCTGCSICELACSSKKEGLFNLAKSRIRVIKRGLPHQVVVITCTQCLKASCQIVCPTNAITRDEITKALIVNENLCIGCGLCVDACPIGSIKLHPNNHSAIKCDLCNGDPECVKKCPREALSYSTGNNKISENIQRIFKQSLEEKGFSEDDFYITKNG